MTHQTLNPPSLTLTRMMPRFTARLLHKRHPLHSWTRAWSGTLQWVSYSNVCPAENPFITSERFTTVARLITAAAAVAALTAMRLQTALTETREMDFYIYMLTRHKFSLGEIKIYVIICSIMAGAVVHVSLSACVLDGVCLVGLSSRDPSGPASSTGLCVSNLTARPCPQSLGRDLSPAIKIHLIFIAPRPSCPLLPSSATSPSAPLSLTLHSVHKLQSLLSSPPAPLPLRYRCHHATAPPRALSTSLAIFPLI